MRNNIVSLTLLFVCLFCSAGYAQNLKTEDELKNDDVDMVDIYSRFQRNQEIIKMIAEEKELLKSAGLRENNDINDYLNSGNNAKNKISKIKLLSIFCIKGSRCRADIFTPNGRRLLVSEGGIVFGGVKVMRITNDRVTLSYGDNNADLMLQ